MKKHTEAAPNVLELLDNAELPATKAELVAYAADNDASEEALDMIQAMPDIEYHSIRQINKGLGMIEDLPGTDNGFWNLDAKMPPPPSEKRIRARFGKLGSWTTSR